MGERLCPASTPLCGGYFCRVFTVLLPCFFRVVFESFSRCISNRLLMEYTKTIDYWQRDRGGIARNREGNREADRERTGKEQRGNGEGTERERRGNGEGTEKERGGNGEGTGASSQNYPIEYDFSCICQEKALTLQANLEKSVSGFPRLVPINRHVNIRINRFLVLSFKL